MLLGKRGLIESLEEEDVFGIVVIDIGVPGRGEFIDREGDEDEEDEEGEEGKEIGRERGTERGCEKGFIIPRGTG